MGPCRCKLVLMKGLRLSVDVFAVLPAELPPLSIHWRSSVNLPAAKPATRETWQKKKEVASTFRNYA